jgi:predicted dehydrogenase
VVAVRVGIVGCGLIARIHRELLRSVPEARIVAVHDLDPARAEVFAADCGAIRAGSLDEVVERCDAVYVCTWTSAHAEAVMAAAGAGRAVFCEKPLAPDLGEAEAMVAAVRTAGVVNQAGLVLRHRGVAVRWLHHLITDAAAGPVQNVVFRDDQFLPVQGLYGSDWRADRVRAGAGTLLEHSVHDLDILDWLLGPIERLSAEVANHHGIDGIEDAASCLVRGAGGAQGVLTSTWHDVLSRPSQRRIEVLCRDRFVALEGEWLGPVVWEDADGSTHRLAGEDLVGAVRALGGPPLNPARAFVRAVGDGAAAHPDLEVALRAQRLVAAAYDSAAAGGAPRSVSP